MEMEKSKKIAIIAVLVIALLAIFGLSKLSTKNAQAPQQAKNTVTTDAPKATGSQQNTTAAVDQATATSQDQLQPLPADDKQAIDSELSNIDKELKSTDNSVKSTDLSNVNLGL